MELIVFLALLKQSQPGSGVAAVGQATDLFGFLDLATAGGS